MTCILHSVNKVLLRGLAHVNEVNQSRFTVYNHDQDVLGYGTISNECFHNIYDSFTVGVAVTTRRDTEDVHPNFRTKYILIFCEQ